MKIKLFVIFFTFFSIDCILGQDHRNFRIFYDELNDIDGTTSIEDLKDFIISPDQKEIALILPQKVYILNILNQKIIQSFNHNLTDEKLNEVSFSFEEREVEYNHSIRNYHYGNYLSRISNQADFAAMIGTMENDSILKIMMDKIAHYLPYTHGRSLKKDKCIEYQSNNILCKRYETIMPADKTSYTVLRDLFPEMKIDSIKNSLGYFYKLEFDADYAYGKFHQDSYSMVRYNEIFNYYYWGEFLKYTNDKGEIFYYYQPEDRFEFAESKIKNDLYIFNHKLELEQIINNNTLNLVNVYYSANGRFAFGNDLNIDNNPSCYIMVDLKKFNNNIVYKINENNGQGNWMQRESIQKQKSINLKLNAANSVFPFNGQIKTGKELNPETFNIIDSLSKTYSIKITDKSYDLLEQSFKFYDFDEYKHVINYYDKDKLKSLSILSEFLYLKFDKKSQDYEFLIFSTISGYGKKVSNKFSNSYKFFLTKDYGYTNGSYNPINTTIKYDVKFQISNAEIIDDIIGGKDFKEFIDNPSNKINLSEDDIRHILKNNPRVLNINFDYPNLKLIKSLPFEKDLIKSSHVNIEIDEKKVKTFIAKEQFDEIEGVLEGNRTKKEVWNVDSGEVSFNYNFNLNFPSIKFNEENIMSNSGYTDLEKNLSLVNFDLKNDTLNLFLETYDENHLEYLFLNRFNYYSDFYQIHDYGIIGKSKNNQYVFISEPEDSDISNLRKVAIIDQINNAKLELYQSILGSILTPQFYNNYTRLLFPKTDKHFEFYNLTNGVNKKIADYYYYSENEWYVVTLDGFYDKSDFAKDNLYYVYNNSEVFDLDDFQKNYRVEGLLDMLKAGKSPRDEFPNVLSLKEQIKNLPPIIDYELNDNVLKGDITMRRGGANNVFLNIAGRDIEAIKPQFKTDSTASISINLENYKDYFIPNADNTLYVRATNSSNSIKTKGPTINYNYKPEQKKKAKQTGRSSKPYNPNAKLYALFVGINKYNKNPLEFAVNDADKMKDYIELINSEWGNNYNASLDYKPEITFLPDSLAVKDNIEKALESISKKARAQDIVMLFFSGHGIAADAINPNKNKKDAKGNKNQNFYYITKDFDTFNYTSFSELDINDDLSSPQAISSDQLKAFLSNKDLKAQKKILVMDACYSGQFLEEVKGNPKSDLTREQQQALRDLNDKTGTVIITASRSKEKAYEADKYQHSFLTWGLIKALKEDYSRDDDLLNVSNWLLNTKNIVENQSGSNKTQRPSISLNKDVDFQLGLINTEIQKSIELKEPLFIMNLAEINADDDNYNETYKIANDIENELNKLFRRNAENENLNKRAITIRQSTNATIGYQLKGYVIKNENKIIVQYRLLNENIPVELNNPSCDNNQNQFRYCFELPIENYKNNLPILVSMITNHLKSISQNEE